MEEVDACDTLHLIHGVDIVSFGAIASLVFVDETDGTGSFSHAQHHFKECFRHGHFVLADGFVLRFIQYMSTKPQPELRRLERVGKRLPQMGQKVWLHLHREWTYIV